MCVCTIPPMYADLRSKLLPAPFFLCVCMHPGYIRTPCRPLRESAMAAYYAQHAYKAKHGSYTADLVSLVPFIPAWLNVGPHAIDGTCAKGRVTTSQANGTFDVTFTSLDGKASSHVNDVRYLTVTKALHDAAEWSTSTTTSTTTSDSNTDVEKEDTFASQIPIRALLAPSFVGTDWSKLAVKEVAMPNISTPTTVIVQVVGSSVNPVDWKIIEARLFPGQ